ncbi:peroxiredoxin family protein [Reinekea blandensis]|nr:peroxiredoxin family protein [Reinekea blandensis]
MRLTPPAPAQTFEAQDIYGETVRLTDFAGKKVMLCFFRDAACPFCNFRVYELTHRYRAWKARGVEVIAVFSSTAEEVREHVARYPRPFRLIADSNLDIYNQYGVEKSGKALWKALLFKMPRIIRGMVKGGRPRPNPHVTLVPADFLIDTKGHIQDCWYGRNTSDHIPLERVDAFIGRDAQVANTSAV